PGQTRRRLQPVNPLGYPPATQAVDATYRQLQQDALVEQIAITHLANPPIMNQRTGLATTSALGGGAGLRRQFDQQGAVGRGATDDDVVAWPESSKISRMDSGSRECRLVRLETANLPASLTVNSLFPLIPRRTFFVGPGLSRPAESGLGAAWCPPASA